MAAFRYVRTIHFPDTDAAGVVFFARYLSIAHEGYEEALADHGLPLASIFANHGVIIPIAKSEASYLRPLVTGEKIVVELAPARLNDSAFAIDTTIWKTDPRENVRPRSARNMCASIQSAGKRFRSRLELLPGSIN